MIDAIWLKAAVKAIVLPPTGPLLVAALGIFLVARHPRFGRALAALGVGVLLVLSVPVVAVALLRLLDDSPLLDAAAAKSAKALVILGGGTRRNAAEYGGDTLGRLTLERVRYGARVARATGLPVMVAGGSVYGGDTEASLMRDALENEFGVKVHWAEAQSRTTHENAKFASAMLRDAKIDRVVLVAHSMDMPRARAEFSRYGIAVIPAPTGIPSRDFDGAMDFLPSMAGLQSSYYAIYELVALGVLRVAPAD